MARAISLTLLMAVLSGCAKQPERNLFAEAEHLYLDQRYDEAVVLLKQHLARHPEDAGAHFYLGTCYLSSPKNGWLGIAQGELQTALALFERQGKINPIPRFNDSTYFELICHINLAKVYLRLILNIMDMDSSQLQLNRRTAVRTLTKGLLEQYETAQRIDPRNPDVEGLRQRIEEVQLLLRSLPPPNAPSPVNRTGEGAKPRFARVYRFAST